MTKAEAETKAEAKILGKLVLVGNSEVMDHDQNWGCD